MAVVYNSAMQYANLWAGLAEKEHEVRVARQDDARAVTRLLREAPFSHVHADWHAPADWMGRPSFVVIPAPAQRKTRQTLPSRFFGQPPSLEACLAVAADPQPGAWVRLAALAKMNRAQAYMAAMLAAIQPVLVNGGTTQIAWLLLDDWPESWLPDLGFSRTNEVVTYEKRGLTLPGVAAMPELRIRSVEERDLPALAAIEERAFEPLWQHSEWGLSLARQQSLSFDVALLDERPVGFQLSSATRRGAHLSRITIDTEHQNRGIGSALLAHALEGYRRQGISTVTLNTQADNVASQRLYERFGFEQSGEHFPIWSVHLPRKAHYEAERQPVDS